VERDAARQIVSGLPADVAKVGVFVNHDAAEIKDAADELRLDYVQLHGDESPEFLAALPRELPVIRAFRCGSAGLAPLASYLDACESLGRMPAAILLDSDVGGSFGGTGHVMDWSVVARERAVLRDLPLILAGGLKPENVSEAIERVRPAAVDVASGVERQAGAKDVELMKRFVAAARTGFARIA
jgi:phosphoribosylanthranilate isomerase